MPVLILIIVGSAYSQGLLDDGFERNVADDPATDIDTFESGLSASDHMTELRKLIQNVALKLFLILILIHVF